MKHFEWYRSVLGHGYRVLTPHKKGLKYRPFWIGILRHDIFLHHLYWVLNLIFKIESIRKLDALDFKCPSLLVSIVWNSGDKVWSWRQSMLWHYCDVLAETVRGCISFMLWAVLTQLMSFHTVTESTNPAWLSLGVATLWGHEYRFHGIFLF